MNDMAPARVPEIDHPQNLPIPRMGDDALDVQGLINRRKHIEAVIKGVMKEGLHYGKIPGTKDNMLYKPGAQILLATFHLNPKYRVLYEIRNPDYISYTMECELIHAPSHVTISSGLGSCNSQEEKYRWRNEETPTGEPVPPKYWDAKRAGDSKEMKRILNGKRARKNEETNKWELFESKKVANDNPRDIDNTLIKMAAKRALKEAIENALAVSDMIKEVRADDDEPGADEPEAQPPAGNGPPPPSDDDAPPNRSSRPPQQRQTKPAQQAPGPPPVEQKDIFGGK